MASRSVAELVIDVAAQVADAVDGFDEVQRGAVDMDRAVGDAADTAERAGRSFGVSAEGADGLASKSSQATGALGALASGFELVGADKYAETLTQASMATDFLSGVGDGLNLILENQGIKTAIAKVQLVGHAVASGASSAATGVMTAAQWALNAAMSANPIGLVVLALVALVAGLVLAYHKSETVRTILQAVGRVGREAVGWVVDKVGDLVGWVGDRLPGAVEAGRRVIVTAFNAYTAGPRLLIDLIGDAVRWLTTRLPAAFETAKNKASAIAGALTKPFRDLWNLLGDIVDKISSIHLPSIPGFGRLAGPAPTSYPVYTPPAPTVVRVDGGDTNHYYYTFNLNGLVTDDQAADVIAELLDRRARQFGLVAP